MRAMRCRIVAIVVGLMVAAVALQAQTPMGTAFTYQGQLNQAGVPVDNTADFEFTLWDDPNSSDPNDQVGSMVPVYNVTIIEGLFTVVLDFGPDIFTGDARWLEVDVRVPAGGGMFTTLSPRQELTPTPHAIYADTAGSVAGGISGSGTADYVAKFLGSNTIGNSAIREAGGKVGIGASPHADYKVYVYHDANDHAGFVRPGGPGVYGKGESHGVYGSGSQGVYGYSAWGYGNEYDDALGVKGYGSRWGVVGDAMSPPVVSPGAAILGLGGEDVYAGWFKGDVYVEGIVGIGVSDPPSYVKLNVAGNVSKGISVSAQQTGGHFENTSYSTQTDIAWADYGIRATGQNHGGYFENSVDGVIAYAASDGYGLVGSGPWAGGYFLDADDGGWAKVGYGANKITGSGSVSFVQNHPNDAEKVIVYACPEGDEVATYTRGTASLTSGLARVRLGETFKWVTNPDIGLTAHLTPHEHAVPLAVVSLTTEELVVRGPADAPEHLVFDYIVYGLRIGFEEVGIVQEKQEEAYIPSMASHRQRYEDYPGLRPYNALERFKAMRVAVGETGPLDLRGSQELRDSIGEFDPAIDRGPGPVRPNLDVPERADQPASDTGAGENAPPAPMQGLYETAGEARAVIQARQDEIGTLRARLEALEALVAELAGVDDGGVR